MGEKQGSKLMRSLYAAFYSGSITQLWPLRDWLDRTERLKLPGYTAATAEAEDASERAAALALKRDVVSAHWAWERDFVTTFQYFSAWATSTFWRHCLSDLG